MDTAQWTQSVGVIVGIAGALVGIAGALVVSFWRGATLAQTITQAITESEERLRNENKMLGEKIEALKVDVAVLSARQDDDRQARARQERARQERFEINPAQLARALFQSDAGDR